MTDTDPTASWIRNAAAWTKAVRSGSIESRRLVTDAAIVDAVVARCPTTVLDLGCGEGWLARRLAPLGIYVMGIDASAPLIAVARAAGGGQFDVLAYADLVGTPERVGGPFDLIVANFALLDADPGSDSDAD